jgi:uncharacterized protein YyaL (SSP411 family)
VEGKYYLWTWDEFSSALGKDAAQDAAGFMTVTKEGNFPDPGTGVNVLALHRPFSAFSAPEKVRYAALRRVLRAVRRTRIRPVRDEKILTDANGLTIAALSRAGRVFGSARYIGAATTAARFLLQDMRKDGRLRHRYYRGEAGIAAQCDDYAFLIWGLIELYAATLRPEWLTAACDLQRECHAFLGDPLGGFSLAPRDQKDLFHNPREVRDGAVPSGNGISYQNLVSLSRLTGDPFYATESLALARRFAVQVAGSPSSHSSFLLALDLASGPVVDIVVAGDPDHEKTRTLVAAGWEGYTPETLVLLVPTGPAGDEVRRIAPFTATLDTGGTEPVAYLCSAHQCSLPMHTPEEIRTVKKGQANR